MVGGGWEVTAVPGPAAELHGREPPAGGGRHVWVMEPIRPALVLGSAQREAVAAAPVLGQRGIDLVRRRSGGGAVLVRPGAVLWVDVVIPHGDVLWDDDVTASFRWVGEAWRAALAACGVPAAVHTGPPEPGPWARLVCFAGIGSGELLVDGRKVVGLSQRRTRTTARYQSLVYLDDRAVGEVVELLAEPAGEADRRALRAWLGGRAQAVAAPRSALVRSFLAALPAAH